VNRFLWNPRFTHIREKTPMAIINSLKKTYNKYYYKLFPTYETELEKAVGNCKSLLDVGCGSSSPVRFFSKKLFCAGVDAFEPSIEKSRSQGIHNKYYKMDVLDIGNSFEPDSFDCVLASDLIEHLTKEEGNKLIGMMEKIAGKKVIIFTPNGFLPQGEYDKNPLQVHKSGWTVKEMKEKGYEVIGINGWKPLRGEYASVRFWPEKIWSTVSDITQYFLRKRPEKTFQILCIKTKAHT
jgi:predicted TPR repeat methyltransferase